MIAKELAVLEENFFSHTGVLSWEQIPPRDEAFVAIWEKYFREAEQTGSLALLQDRQVQLVAPAELRLELYQTWAGRIPVIETCCRTDFVTLVRVLAHKNETVVVPPSMGACLVKGFSIWEGFKKYNCRFLILTDNEYSNVPAEMLGLAAGKWRQLSYLIRREHEATHYYTLRYLSSAKNHLLDEFIADYMGLVVACGQYKADWFLYFLGLENPPAFREGGRLVNYLKNTSLSPDALTILIQQLIKAAVNVESFSTKYKARIYTPEGRYRMLLALSKLNLTILASEHAEAILLESGLHDFCVKEV